MENLRYDVVPIDTLIRKHSGHWFDQDSKRFFNSKWDSHALQNEGSIFAYFISSERHDDDARKYTIRRFNMVNGEVSSPYPSIPIFEFQAFKTKAQAERAMRVYMRKVENIKAEKLSWLQGELEHLRKYETENLVKREADIVKQIAELSLGS